MPNEDKQLELAHIPLISPADILLVRMIGKTLAEKNGLSFSTIARLTTALSEVVRPLLQIMELERELFIYSFSENSDPSLKFIIYVRSNGSDEKLNKPEELLKEDFLNKLADEFKIKKNTDGLKIIMSFTERNS